MSVLGLEIHNGWLLSIFFLIISYVPSLFAGKAAGRLFYFKFGGKKIQVLTTISMILFLVMYIYPVFIKIKTASILFYIGLGISVLSAIFVIIADINYFTTPLDKVITKGVYSFSRNPIYLFTYLLFIGGAMMLNSIIFATIILLNCIITHIFILEEEKYCAEKYGEEYKKFKERVPRYLLFF